MQLPVRVSWGSGPRLGTDTFGWFRIAANRVRAAAPRADPGRRAIVASLLATWRQLLEDGVVRTTADQPQPVDAPARLPRCWPLSMAGW